jgi:TRAP-type transport system periplasmic protein
LLADSVAVASIQRERGSISIKRITRQPKIKVEALRRPFTRRSGLKTSLTVGPASQPSGAPITMRFGSDSPIGAPHTKSALVLKELVQSRTSGRIEVEIFPDSQLGSNKPMTNSISSALPLPRSTCSISRSSTRDVKQVLRFSNGPVGARLKQKINEVFGCEVLGCATDGSRNLWNSRRPVKTPADIAGLKISVEPSKVQRDAILAFGEIPTVVEFNALYTSVQTGLIVAARRPWASFTRSRST